MGWPRAASLRRLPVCVLCALPVAAVRLRPLRSPSGSGGGRPEASEGGLHLGSGASGGLGGGPPEPAGAAEERGAAGAAGPPAGARPAAGPPGGRSSARFWAAALCTYAAAAGAAVALWRGRGRPPPGGADKACGGEDGEVAELEESEEEGEEEEASVTRQQLKDAEARHGSAWAAMLAQAGADDSLAMIKGTRGDTSGLKELRGDNYRDWEKASRGLRYRVGVVTLCVVTLVMLVYRILCLYADFRAKCSGPINWVWRFAELAVLVMAFVGLQIMTAEGTMGKRTIQIRTYWGLLFVYAAYVFACTLPPFQWSCTELVAYCSESKDSVMQQAVMQMDCSLQGQTNTIKFVTLINLLPWMVVEFNMMPYACSLVLFVYMSWTIAYVNLMGETSIFTPGQIFMRALILLVTCFLSSLKKYYLQKKQLDGFIYEALKCQSMYCIFSLLADMLPAFVLRRVLSNKDVADEVPIVSILFVSVDDFQDHVNERTPQDLLVFLNNLFSRFDDICTRHDVNKIESVGEEYVCCVGVMPCDACEEQSHTEALRRLILAAWEMQQLQAQGLAFKMGIHTGPIVAGVICKRLPRYRLFGDTINTAARMMQKGLPGALQFGRETYQHLPSTVLVKRRGTVAMKGIGDVTTYLFEGFSGEESVHTQLCSFSSLAEDGLESARSTRQGSSRTLLSRLLKASTPESLQPVWGASALLGRSLGGPPAGSPEQDDTHRTWVERNDLVEVIREVENSEYAEKKRKLFFSEAAGFSAEMEVEFHRWHHQNTFCKKLKPRIERHLLELITLTIVEIILLMAARASSRDFLYWPAYICFRCAAMAVLVVLRCAVVAAHEWAFHHPSVCQSCILACYSVVALLVYLSYASLTVANDTRAAEVGDVARVGLRAVVEPSRAFAEIFATTQVLSLTFVLVYLRIMRAHVFFLLRSLAWIPVSISILYLERLHAHVLVENGLYFTHGVQGFFMANAILNSFLAHAAEQNDRRWFKAKKAMEETHGRINSMLDTLMPPLVIKDLREQTIQPITPGFGITPTARREEGFQLSHKYLHATVVQSDLSGFTACARTRTPTEVVALLGELFDRFDGLADNLGIWKVETVGDAYIAGQAERPFTETNSPAAVVRFGLQMVGACTAWADARGLGVSCRVGVHHGACTGGVVGTSMQRYHLFGDLMVGVEILESTAPVGRVQVSGACKEAVEGDPAATEWVEFQFQPVENAVLRTSKGEERSSEILGPGPTFLVAHASAG